MRDDDRNPLGDRRQLRAIGLAVGLGCSVVVSLIMCVLGGVLLDQWLDTTPIFTLVGVLLGLLAAGSQLYRLAKPGR